MGCCHYAFSDGNESIFAVDFNSIKYGPGALQELAIDVQSLGIRRIGLFTDKAVRSLESFHLAVRALSQAAIDFEIYDETSIEPTDVSFRNAARFAAEGRFDGYVSIGGGSVIDTCKAANLYSTYPAEFAAYVNPPVGAGTAVPGPLLPHVACPTTSGTGSECTGIAVFDWLDKRVKTGIASAHLKPARAVVDPAVTATLPANVVAASGFDVLSHALESYTARPYTQRSRPTDGQRPLSQGANPYSDMGCRQALELCGKYLVRAVQDATDETARHSMMLAATLAGIAFGNSGVHIPHGMAYSVAGLAQDYTADGYPPGHALVPHGISVIVNAPAAFQFTATSNLSRHLEAASLLGAPVSDADADDLGSALSEHLKTMMRQADMPNGISGVGYADADLGDLAAGAFMQQRLLSNAPCAVSKEDLESIYQQAMRYW